LRPRKSVIGAKSNNDRVLLNLVVTARVNGIRSTSGADSIMHIGTMPAFLWNQRCQYTTILCPLTRHSAHSQSVSPRQRGCPGCTRSSIQYV